MEAQPWTEKRNTARTRLSWGLLWWVVYTSVHMYVHIFFLNRQKQQGGGEDMKEQ